MEFDNIIAAPCEASQYPDGINPATCKPAFGGGPGGGSTDDPCGGDPGSVGCSGGVIPPANPTDDPRCADPAFYDANPTICAGYPKLVLKPETSIVETGKTVQYKTFVRNGGNEMEITAGLIYEIGDATVAWISRAEGLASGVTPGTTTVSVKWQGYSAHGTLEVVQSCSDLDNSFLLLIDRSKSMTQGFSGNFSTKLVYAKEAAKAFINSTNLSKDSIAVAAFGTGGAILQEMTQDVGLILDAVNAIIPTSEKTDMDSGLRLAVEYMNRVGTGTKVIILLTDGENNGGIPLDRAADWKAVGNILVVVGERCWGQYFDLLFKLATGGFFLSAYEATQGGVIQTLAGLKSYLCSGSCFPEPGTYPTPQLDYDGFINWDVGGADGDDYFVDLCGLGPQNFDVLPGHGLYVDMSGSYGPALHSGSGSRLTSKTAFPLVKGHTYTFKIKVAGHNRPSSAGVAEDNKPVQITVGSYLQQIITPTDPLMPFTQFSFQFVASADSSEHIVIEQIIQSGKWDTVFGSFIDDVYLEDTTTAMILLSDSFDTENPTTISNQNLGGYGYSYGCLVTPPGAQAADPTPPTPTMIE